MINTRALVTEFIGTFGLIFIGAGAGALGLGGLVGVALAHSLFVIGFIYAYDHISGSHINPAVTIGMLVGKQIDAMTAVTYIIAQLSGGMIGALLLRVIFGGGSSLGATVLADGVTVGQGLVIEIILTFFLVNSIFNTAVRGKVGNTAGGNIGGGNTAGGNTAPVAIGFTLAACILMGGPLTGASLNPARSLGPAIASGNFSNIWVYFVGPIIGAVLAALLYTYVLSSLLPAKKSVNNLRVIE